MVIKNKKNFLIAEAGINHNGNLKTALKLVDADSESSPDAVKLQKSQAYFSGSNQELES